MKNTALLKMKTGLFTIAGILILGVGVFIIGSNKNMFSSTYNIYGIFKSIGGLQAGNNVLFSGILAGTVDNISLITDTTIRVDMRIKSEIRPYLKIDALATIGSSGLMGDKLIMLIPGSPGEVAVLQGGAQIRTVNPIGLEEMMAKFAVMADNAGVITTELAGMAIQIREGNGTINRLLYSNELSKTLEGAASNAEDITRSLAGITAKINAGTGTIGNLVNTNSLSDSMDNVIVSAQSAMGTIQMAADGFSENMKALQGNIFLRGYFKRKAREMEAGEASLAKNADSLDMDMDEGELIFLIAEAQRALDKKVKEKSGIRN
jgi:phospholipid/cholesterol/gamma-HCH transport system substrate-binding protein